MKISNHIFILLAISLCISCENSQIEYNKKATVLIIQTVKHNKCDCILYIPTQSKEIISDIKRKTLSKRLKLLGNENIDSLYKLTRNFKIDYLALKENNIKIIPIEYFRRIRNSIEIRNKCPKGIIYIGKPIFNDGFNRAAMKYGFPYFCTPGYVHIYELRNGKWKETRD